MDPQALTAFGVLYLSGITLSALDGAGGVALLQTSAEARAREAQVVCDANFRPRGWPNPAPARRLYDRLFGFADLVLVSSDYLVLLHGDDSEAALLRYARGTDNRAEDGPVGGRGCSIAVVRHSGAIIPRDAMPKKMQL